MRISEQQKICPVCGRPFSNRKRWDSRGQWEQIKYCSDSCRRKRKHIKQQ
ncbi:DUF2256 domain-containing protein [Salinispira pacifica]